MWVLRPVSNPLLDTKELYEGKDTLFSIKLMHGGEFTKFPDVRYKNGAVRFVDNVDIDHFSVHQLDKIMKGLGYKVPPFIYYHFRLPEGDFLFGIRALGNDDDILNLRQYVKDHKVIRVYTEHGTTKLLTYFMAPPSVKNVVIEELVEDVQNPKPDTEVVATPPRQTTLVLPCSPKVDLPVSISPEYNRKRGWRMVIGLFDCTRQLFTDEEVNNNVDGEDGIVGDVEVKSNGDVITDMTVDEHDMMNVEEAANKNGEKDVNSNGEKDVINNGENDVNSNGEKDVNSNGENDVINNGEKDVNSNGEKDVINNGEKDVNSNGEKDVNTNAPGNVDLDFDLYLYEEILASNAEWEFEQTNFEVLRDNIHREEQYTADMGEFANSQDDTHREEEYEADMEVENDDDESSDSQSSEGSDFWVDEDNLMPDVEVNMRDFNLNIDQEAEYMERRIRVVKGSDSEEEDVDVIDNDQWDSLGEDSDLDRKRRGVLQELGKEIRCSQGELHKVTFRIGQKYRSKKVIKDKVHVHALESRRNLFFIKNDKCRLRIVCNGTVPCFNGSEVSGVVAPTPAVNEKGKGKKKGKGSKDKGDTTGMRCTWVLQASRRTEEDYWFVKTYNPSHICLPTRKIKSATAKFLSNEIMEQVEANPTIPIRALQEQLQKKYNVGFSIHKIFRAKAAAVKHVVGDWTKQYELLRDYIMELQSINEGTTVKLDMVSEPNVGNSTRKFKRIYVCLGALKRGFRAGLREFLGLDGAFMKGPFPGQILTAVGLDSNNGIYPLAYAIVETENTQSWKWFLDCLRDDLDLKVDSNFTFISDRKKGLIPALAEMFPSAEHRFCLRHIYENMRKTWRTKEYKDHLWQCATASTMQEFTHYMRELSDFDNTTYEWLMKIPPHHWARSHFTGRATSDMLLNNLCEVFNSKLIDGRDKPIISCLEFIREYCMKRICNVVKVQDKCVGPLTPSATKIMDTNIDHASQYTVRWSGHKYQVRGPWQDQHVVDLAQSTCTCRKWELTGIPCKHVIAALNDRADNGEHVGELYTYAHKVHWLETWKAAYAYKVDPIKGRTMWPTSACPVNITPPAHHTQPGRPKKKRKQSAEEKIDKKAKTNGAGPSGSQVAGSSGPVGSGKLTRKYITVTCSKCKNKGHNARTCKGQGGNAGRGEGGNGGTGATTGGNAGKGRGAGTGAGKGRGAGPGAGKGRGAGPGAGKGRGAGRGAGKGRGAGGGASGSQAGNACVTQPGNASGGQFGN